MKRLTCGTPKKNIQFLQKLSAKRDGAAAAAGAAGMDILYRVVEYKGSAVRQFAAQRQVIALAQFQQHLFPQLPQITGDDQIEILRLASQILHVGTNGIKGRRCHGSAHVVGILDAQIRHGADGAAFDPRPRAGGADQRCTGAGDRPLSGGCPLTAVAQRETVLPL